MKKVTSVLLSTFEEVEIILAKVSGNVQEEDSGESQGSDDSQTNTQTGDYTKTDDTFFKMYIEPKIEINKGFLVQDLVKSNNPFLETKPITGTTSNTTPSYGNEYLGFNFQGNNSTPPVTNNPPQQLTFSFQSEPRFTTTTNFNSQNEFFNSKPIDQTRNTPTLFEVNTTSNDTGKSQITNNQPYVDLFGTKTTQNNNQNDPFKDLFSLYKGEVGTGSGSNPFSNLNTTNTGTKYTNTSLKNPFL